MESGSKSNDMMEVYARCFFWFFSSFPTSLQVPFLLFLVHQICISFSAQHMSGVRAHVPDARGGL